jgi:uncharacterized protein YbjT (DUF2867 family)
MSKKVKNALVIGASGLVGKALLEELSALESCQKIRVFVRSYQTEFEAYDKVEQKVLADFLTIQPSDVSDFSHAFSCLGTTQKQAGSKEKFFAIDYGLNAHFIDLLKNTDTHFVLISATGANANSLFFYNRVKGQLEDYLQQANLNTVSVLRPSLLLGDRQGQRALEEWSQQIFNRVSPYLPQYFSFKPVTARQVAHTMVSVAGLQTEKFKIYDNLQILKTT